MKSKSLVLCVFVSLLSSVLSKKYYSDDGGFQPSNLRYYESNLPGERQNATAKAVDKESRFGIPISTGYGPGVSGYPGNVGYASPVKIDIGGVAIGALIGLGAILVLPKIATLFSGGYGYRSLDNELPSLTDVMARIDDSLEKHNIDSSSCMQRVICSYVNDAQRNIENGEKSTVDEIIYNISSNSLFSLMLDGSAIKQAVDLGKSGNVEKCDKLATKCPITKENITQVIASLLPS